MGGWVRLGAQWCRCCARVSHMCRWRGAGGWVQNDEAVSSFDAVIDQMTEGHLWLQDTLGGRSFIGWQLDPFGNMVCRSLSSVAAC